MCYTNVFEKHRTVCSGRLKIIILYTMGGSLLEEEMEFLFNNIPELKDLNIFIECGTYKGDSSRLASKFFKDVYTFEINQRLFEESMLKSLEKNIMNVHHYLGNSYDLTKLIIQNDRRPALFFLDAHISGNDSSYNGKELVPVMQELKVINEHYSQDTLGIVIVDDYRLWNKHPIPDDWAHITNEKILQALSNHKITSTFEINDRMYIIINRVTAKQI